MLGWSTVSKRSVLSMVRIREVGVTVELSNQGRIEGSCLMSGGDLEKKNFFQVVGLNP